jgi:alpha-glucan phosphorylase-like protein
MSYFDPASNEPHVTPGTEAKAVPHTPFEERLTAFAADLWWTGRPAAHTLWRDLDPYLYEAVDHNPGAMIAEGALERMPHGWQARAEALLDLHQDRLKAPFRDDVPRTAYMCMEYGLHESVPIYSGGLGMLAGDHLRSAADMDIPLVAVGFLWREGYFRQVIRDGRQGAAFCPREADRLPVRPLLGPDGRRLVVYAPGGVGRIAIRAWELRLAKVRLLLLDTDHESNAPEVRRLTDRLYGGDTRTRLLQEIVLGIGGARMLRAAGIEPECFHLNEGHAAFVTLELWARGLAEGHDPSAAWARVRNQCVFTTHTPVPAGHDRFHWHMVDPLLGPWRHRLGLPAGAFMDRGRERPGDVDEPLCMTVLGMRGSREVNGVSKLHGEVTREMWDRLPRVNAITHVTNGVHPGAWLAPETEALWDAHLPDWREHLADRPFWDAVEDIPAADILAARDARRGRLVSEVRRRTGLKVLDPKRLTIGFARRFATYKRGDLIFSDPDRLERLLDQGVQIVYAGKAHPADEKGQAIIARILHFVRQPRFRDHVVFIPDYDMAIGRLLTACCDVWLNNPRRPREASGTSGQKAAMNGNLNLSILDGWWPEAFDGDNGWAIEDGRDPAFVEAKATLAELDAEDALGLYAVLEDSVVPAFASESRWAQMSAHAMATCAPAFNTHRMVGDYARDIYAGESRS